MNKYLADLIEKETSPVNDDIVAGLAVKHFKHVEDYMDIIFRSGNNIVSHLENQLVYVGYKRCTPQEEYEKIASLGSSSKRIYDLDRSDFYLVKYLFKYRYKDENGEYIEEDLKPLYVYLPFVGEAGIMHISGVMYHITPILTDKVISPEKNSVFIKLFKIKMIYDRTQWQYSIVDQPQPECVYIPYQKTKNKSSGKSEKFKPSAFFYLLGKYGFTETFKKYIGHVPIVVKEEEYDPNAYPSSEYIICRSQGMPIGANYRSLYKKPDLYFIIPKDKWNKEYKIFIGNLFYVLDGLSGRATLDKLDQISYWRYELSILLNGKRSDTLLFSKINEHYRSLDYYIDPYADLKIIRQLYELGYEVNDFYDLLALLVINIDKWIIESQKNVISVYNRYLEILYYILYELTSSAFSIFYKYVTLASKKQLSRKEVDDIVNDIKNPKSLKMKKIYNLSKMQNIALSTIDYSGDTKYPHITSIIALQEHGEGVRRAKHKRTKVDSTKHLHPSKILFGSLHYLPKKHPTPEMRINPFIKIDDISNSMIVDKEVKKVLDALELMLDGKLPEELEVKPVKGD